MKRSTFMVIAAILAFFFGAAFILVPAQFMSYYGVTLGEAGQFVGRYLGSAFIGVAALTFLARKSTESVAMRAVLAGDFIISLTGLAVAVWDKLTGPGNALVWSTVAIYLLLTVGFGYYLVTKPKGA